MKIKGPGNYSGLPGPPEEVNKGEGKGKTSFTPETAGAQQTESAGKSKTVGQTSAFESSLQEIARTVKKEGASGDVAVGKVIDSVLEQVMGKEFLGKPEASSLKAAMVPMLSQDEHFMNKLNNVLARLQKA